MALTHSNISKGYYRYPQIEHFITVKNYLFSFHGEQKYLLLRFSNDADFTVNSMEFTIMQLDSTGAVLETTKVTCSNLQFAPGCTYTAKQGIVVHDSCTDFKLQFSKLTSDKYIYQVEGRKITVLYDQPLPPLVPSVTHVEPIKQFHVQTIPLRRRNLSVLLGIAVVLILLLLSIAQIYDQYNPPKDTQGSSGYETTFLPEGQAGVF